MPFEFCSVLERLAMGDVLCVLQCTVVFHRPQEGGGQTKMGGEL